MTTSPTLSPTDGGVLVASPSTRLRAQVLRSFEGRRRAVYEVLGGAEALAKLQSGNWQIIYLDRRLPDLDAEELIQIIRRRFPGIEVVLVDSDTDAYLKGGSPMGAFSQPAAEHEAVAPDTNDLDTGGDAVEPLPGMIGRSAPMQRLYRMARLVAGRMTTVLISGPTGAGKELVARAIHQLSPRCSRPFVVVNCAAIPESLLESELFGHVRGSFTGAIQNWNGRIQAAQGGTLFLDEIGEMPLGLQSKLLRFLDQKEVQRLGSTESLRLDVRVIAATNANLVEKVHQGYFRRDLYYRLAAFPLDLPGLAERPGDIGALATHFLNRFAGNGLSQTPELGRESLQLLRALHWEGNVRELEHMMERAVIFAEGAKVILPEHLGAHVQQFGRKEFVN
ncbi:MAG TPA: sigma-54 dependent transcriptional regulator [Terriglobales bacterium]